MSTEAAFRCPVCRASQTASDTCRRCQADLSLVMRAYRRLAWVKQEKDKAGSRGDSQSEQLLADELRWLAPSR